MNITYECRKDYNQLRKVCEEINRQFSQLYAWFTPREDGELDIHIYNFETQTEHLFEVKTISPKYGTVKNNPYWSTKSARGSSWKWCDLNHTQEEISRDTTQCPDLGDTPIIFINSANSKGDTIHQKEHKILSNNAGLIFLAKDGILFFSPKEIRKAIIGHGWNYQATDEYYGKSKKAYEYKALIDMSLGYFMPLNNVTEDMLTYVKQSGNSGYLS